MAGESGPATVAVRTAVRDGLREGLRARRLRAGDLVLVGCSGGPDSLALAAATAWVAPRVRLRAGAVVVDHGLQSGSAQVAAYAAEACRGMGLGPVDVVGVDARAGSGRGGPEHVARRARRGAYLAVAARHRAAAVLLGHTRDDQAETVLLGLARGSGARALGGMAPWTVIPAPEGDLTLVRPMLGLDRDTVRACAAETGLRAWADPHNADPAYARSRVRVRALPALESALGPGVVAALARSADLLRADADALDDIAAAALSRLREPADAAAGTAPEVALPVSGLQSLPTAVRTRVLLRAVVEVGAPPARVTAEHIRRVDRLVVDWHGQGAVDLPGRVRAARAYGRLRLAGRPLAGGGTDPISHP